VLSFSVYTNLSSSDTNKDEAYLCIKTFGLGGQILTGKRVIVGVFVIYYLSYLVNIFFLVC